MTDTTRRSVLQGLGTGLALMLTQTPLARAAFAIALTGDPGRLDLRLDAITANVLRIGIAPANSIPPEQELGVVKHPLSALLNSSSEKSPIAWGKYRIRVEAEPLSITVTDANQHIRQQIQFDTDSTTIRFRLGSQPLYGLGEGTEPGDLRGTKDPMRNGEGGRHLLIDGARLPIPWLISPEGWGLFIGQPFGFTNLTGEMGTIGSSAATSTRNVYLILGDTPSEILRGYADLTGYPHLPPLWSLGYMQSHRTISSKEEILGIAQTFREKKLPCDALIYLGTGFCPSGWNTGHGSFTFNDKVFPDPREIFRQFHDQHFKVILHAVLPSNFHGTIADTGACAAEPGDAVSYWAEHMPIEQVGVDGWWPDEGDGLPVEARLQRNQMYWDGQIKAHPDRRPFALNRNGYAGLQRYGWLWSGDIDSNWQALAAQVANAINIGLCGIPYWGTDTGGFVPTRELTPELYIRWFQFSAFCPLFRSHGRAWKLRLPWGWNMGTPGPLEGAERITNWPPEQDLHNPQVEPICRKYLNLRYQMLPYIYSAAEQSHRTGLPLVRALWIHWPQDPKAIHTADEYMWGDNILVAPVLQQGATRRTTYLPAGKWWDFWSNKQVTGGTDVTSDADLETIPLYVRAGAIIPIGPIRQYATEPNAEPITLRIYPGADGKFDWYEDDGTSFRYRQGDFTRIECAWNNASRKLTLTRAKDTRPTPGRKVKIQAMDKETTKTITLKERVTTIDLS